MEYLKRLEESLVTLEDSAEKLSKIPHLIKSVIELTAELQKEKDQYSETYSELEKIKSIMEKQSKDICDYIEEEKRTREEFIAVMKTTLIQSNKENIEMYSTLSSAISHKVEVAENKLDTTITKGMTKMEQSFETINKNVTETQKMVPIVSRAQILLIISIVIGIVSCGLHFI